MERLHIQINAVATSAAVWSSPGTETLGTILFCGQRDATPHFCHHQLLHVHRDR